MDINNVKKNKLQIIGGVMGLGLIGGILYFLVSRQIESFKNTKSKK